MAKSGINEFRSKILKSVPEIVKDFANDSLEHALNHPIKGREQYRSRMEKILTSSDMDEVWKKLVKVLNDEQQTHLVTFIAGIIPYRWARFSKSEGIDVIELKNPNEALGQNKSVKIKKSNRPSEDVRKDILSDLEQHALEIERILRKYPTIETELELSDSNLQDVVLKIAQLAKIAGVLRLRSRADQHPTVTKTMPTKKQENSEYIHFCNELLSLFMSWTGRPHLKIVDSISTVIFDLGKDAVGREENIKKYLKQMRNSKKGKIR